jgi:hypothetical protein
MQVWGTDSRVRRREGGGTGSAQHGSTSWLAHIRCSCLHVARRCKYTANAQMPAFAQARGRMPPLHTHASRARAHTHTHTHTHKCHTHTLAPGRPHVHPDGDVPREPGQHGLHHQGPLEGAGAGLPHEADGLRAGAHPRQGRRAPGREARQHIQVGTAPAPLRTRPLPAGWAGGRPMGRDFSVSVGLSAHALCLLGQRAGVEGRKSPHGEYNVMLSAT